MRKELQYRMQNYSKTAFYFDISTELEPGREGSAHSCSLHLRNSTELEPGRIGPAHSRSLHLKNSGGVIVWTVSSFEAPFLMKRAPEK